MTKIDKKVLATIFKYILDEKYLTAKQAKKTFGYKSISNIHYLKDDTNTKTLTKPHMELLRLKHQIPTRIWNTKKNYTNENFKKMIIKYRRRVDYKIDTLKSNSNNFENNSKYLPLLKGTWYIYSHAVHPNRYYDDVVLRVTTIHDDYSVTDTDGGVGYLHIREKESYIEKETKDIKHIVLIRFFNKDISNEVLPCSISASVTDETNNPLLSFGFMSRHRYSSLEAREILGEELEIQLKIDSKFLGNISQEVKKLY